MKHVRILKQAGFPASDFILLVAIIFIFSGGAVVILIKGFDTYRSSTETLIADQYAKDGIDAVRSIANQSYSNLVAKTGTGLTRASSGSSSNWAFSGANNQFGPQNMYTRVITISSVYRDDSGNIVSNGGKFDPNTMKAIATVTWNNTPTHINSVVQTTYFTNWSAPAN
jgi:hypothetical protein